MAFTSTTAFSLLARDDDSGKLLIDTQRFDLGLAGAALFDLSIAGRITLDGKTIAVVDRTPIEPSCLGAVLARIVAEVKPRSPRWWIQKLAAKQLRQAVLADLIAAGALRRTTKEVLGLFPSERFVPADPAAEAEVRRVVEAVLRGERTPDPASSNVIMLLDVTGLLRRQFGKHPARVVKSIVAGEWAGAAVDGVVDQQRAVRSSMHGSMDSAIQPSMQAAIQAQMNAAIAGSIAASVAASTAATA
jgi:hypothetical protein